MRPGEDYERVVTPVGRARRGGYTIRLLTMSEQESRPAAEERCPRCDSILPEGAERCLMCGLARPPAPPPAAEPPPTPEPTATAAPVVAAPIPSPPAPLTAAKQPPRGRLPRELVSAGDVYKRQTSGSAQRLRAKYCHIEGSALRLPAGSLAHSWSTTCLLYTSPSPRDS